VTAERIEQKLQSRQLSQTTFAPRDPKGDWVVWLWAPDDPGCGVAVGEGEKYEDALREALLAYDLDQKTADAEIAEKMPV
jgi:hypothetical protein